MLIIYTVIIPVPNLPLRPAGVVVLIAKVVVVVVVVVRTAGTGDLYIRELDS